MPVLFLLVAGVWAQPTALPRPLLPPRTEGVLNHISAASLRGHLSFIASDLLEGRATPSRGLDLAAEYIASQFRRAGLEPAGDDGYFQTAEMHQLEPARTGIEIKIEHGGRTIAVESRDITSRFHDALDLPGAPIYQCVVDDEAALKHLQPDDVRDQVLMVELPEFNGAAASQAARNYGVLLGVLRRVRPKLTLMLTLSGMAELDSTLVHAGDERFDEPVIVIRSPELFRYARSLPQGPTGATLSLHIPAAREAPVKLHNVIGLLRGSDTSLKSTYVLVTAHYDHLGMKTAGTGDPIFNGANDDGSGTVSVIELASALATLQPRPKRSIVFLTFFGEEEGTLGSLYYAKHPVFPIDRTIGDVNLEQLGRTDAVDGNKLSQATFTGFEYSDLPRVFEAAGARTGVRVLSDASFGDSFFGRSDNAPLAEQGIPAHTLAVAFEFPDYHTAGDKWQKVDYDNMAKIDRMVALGLMMMADNPEPPKWNRDNHKADRYSDARKAHHGGGNRD
jgi:hypothetical protein